MAEQNVAKLLNGMDIKQYKTDVGFRTLVEGVNENLYVIPKYQRKYRWKKEQLIALVESLIFGYPIPPIYTCRNEKNQLEILDGQQRVMSLFFYYIGYYMNSKRNACVNFSEIDTEHQLLEEALLKQVELEELHINLEKNEMSINVDYAALPIELKRQVDYVPITIIEIKIDDEKRKSQILRQIFSNLNRGGSSLSDQEQRNGVYLCEFYDMLQELNRNYEPWRNVWGKEKAEGKDLEALLRLCALKRFTDIKPKAGSYDFIVEGYKSSYVEFLDRFSEEAMMYDGKKINAYRKSIIDFLDLFHTNRKFSSKITLLESLYVVYEKRGIKKNITDKIYNDILSDEKYTSCARQGTVKMKHMNERWKATYEIWNKSNE